ncbi:MAG TPA: GAF domain-containing protein [Longimicrobiales bacterium]|nr:GAF domain-containing protein [Longimicrobiales bacterium]
MTERASLKADQLEALRRFEELLEVEGVHAALAFLNARTGHRFTGIYRFDPPILRNVHIYDRTNPTLEVTDDAPLRETYCSVVGSTGAPFATADSQADERLREHPARASTLSYCGVPLHTSDGTHFGTLCHFDLAPRTIRESEIAVMERAGARLMGRLETGPGRR